MNTNDLPWKTLREHIVHKHLVRDEQKNLQMDIIKLPPDFTFGEHMHPEAEWIYILKGSFSDERGIVQAGDFLINDKNSKHTVTTGKEGCEILCCWCGTVVSQH